MLIYTTGQASVLAYFLSKLNKNEPSKEVFAELPNSRLFSITQPKEEDQYENMVDFLLDYQSPSQWFKDKRR